MILSNRRGLHRKLVFSASPAITFPRSPLWAAIKHGASFTLSLMLVTGILLILMVIYR